MDYELTDYQFGLSASKSSDLASDFAELLAVLKSISEAELISDFNSKQDSKQAKGKKLTKSLSHSVNDLIDLKLRAKGWLGQAAIFGDPDFKKMGWKLDFAKVNNGKGTFAVEVVFNNNGSLGWNVTKLFMACGKNHVKKAVQSQVGIIILATKGLKEACGYDPAIATFEETPLYLSAMQSIVGSTPLVIIGLKAPKTFKIEHFSKTYPDGSKKKAGRVVMLSNGVF